MTAMRSIPAGYGPCLGVLAINFLLLGRLALPSRCLAAEDYQILVFSKTAGFRHDSITNGWAMIQQLGATNSFTTDVTEDASAFTYTNLSRYKAVVWLCTTGDVLDSNQQAA